MASDDAMNSPLTSTGSPIYALMMLFGIAWGAVYWFRESKQDGRVAMIYAAGLAGAFAGAKLAFLFAEGWLHYHDPNRWLVWLSGKSIMGALPGGWLGVEIAKKALGYREITGDRAVAEWVVRGARGLAIALSASADRAGTVRTEVTLD